MAESTPPTLPRPPQLIMDDGSRVFQDKQKTASIKRPKQRTAAQVRHYYELDRMIKTAIRHGDRVAVQLPDALLPDAQTICRILQDESSATVVFLVPGDCCPLAAGVRHGNATLVLHYGHACLSGTIDSTIRVVYGFGKGMLLGESCIGEVLDRIKEHRVRRLLLFYSLEFHEHVEELSTSLSEQGEVLVVAAEIPEPQPESECSSSSCCPNGGGSARNDANVEIEMTKEPSTLREEITKTVGGLQIPVDALETDEDYALLFLGDDSSRQYLNIAMRFLSSEHPPSHWWTYQNNKLRTELSPSFHRLLSRRFYLVQKAKVCRVFGILAANPNSRTMVQRLRHLLSDREGITAYTFVISKINPAKLANFGEIDCFILVACPEHSLLDGEREAYHVPIITPFELLVALDVLPWHSYSTHAEEYWPQQQSTSNVASVQNDQDEQNDDDDAPQFSLVSGTFQAAVPKEVQQERDLSLLPGKGTITTYTSAASEHLQQRTYQGLTIATDAPVHPATKGRAGIASNYSNR